MQHIINNISVTLYSTATLEGGAKINTGRNNRRTLSGKRAGRSGIIIVTYEKMFYICRK